MTGFSDHDWLDDFTRRVKKLMEEVVAGVGEAVDWKILPISQGNRHARFVVTVDGEEHRFQVDQEEQAFGTTDEQIRGHCGLTCYSPCADRAFAMPAAETIGLLALT